MKDGDAKARGRLAHYRDMADIAHASAMNAKAWEARDMCIAIAMAWEALADELEDKSERLKLDQTLKLWGPPLRHPAT